MMRSHTATVVGIALLAVAGTAGAAPQDARTAPGPAHTTNLVVGEPAPDFALVSVDGESYRLAAHGERPILLLFFRGAW